jgi:hypothetical protein
MTWRGKEMTAIHRRAIGAGVLAMAVAVSVAAVAGAFGGPQSLPKVIETRN